MITINTKFRSVASLLIVSLSGIFLSACAPTALTEEQYIEVRDASIAAVTKLSEGNNCWEAISFDMTVDEFSSNAYQLNGITIIRSFEPVDEFSYNGTVTIYAGNHQLQYDTNKAADGDYEVTITDTETKKLLKQSQCPAHN